RRGPAAVRRAAVPARERVRREGRARAARRDARALGRRGERRGHHRAAHHARRDGRRRPRGRALPRRVRAAPRDVRQSVVDLRVDGAHPAAGRDVTPEHVDANGLRFAYLAQGSGPLVLMVHGFPDTARTWDAIAPRVAAAGFRVVAPYTRGYAPTALPPRGADGETLAREPPA